MFDGWFNSDTTLCSFDIILFDRNVHEIESIEYSSEIIILTHKV